MKSPKLNFVSLIVLAFLFHLFGPTQGNVISFKNHALPNTGYYYVTEMLRQEHSWAGKKQSSIFMDLRVDITSVTTEGRLYAFVFPEPLDYLVQMYWDYAHQRRKCPSFASPDILEMNSANVNVSLLLHYQEIPFSPIESNIQRQNLNGIESIGSTNSNIEGKLEFYGEIPYSSRWAIVIFACPILSSSTTYSSSPSDPIKYRVEVNGNIAFENSFGFLSAGLYPLMVSYSSIFPPILSLLIISYTIILVVNRKNDLMPIQIVLLVPLILGLLAFLIQGLVLRSQNSGTPSTNASIIIPQIFIALFHGGFRFVMLYVCHGFGIVFYQGRSYVYLAITLFCGINIMIEAASLSFDALRNSSYAIAVIAFSVIAPIFSLIYFIWASFVVNQASKLAINSRQPFKIQLYEHITMVFQVSTAVLFVIGVLDLLKNDITSFHTWPLIWIIQIFREFAYLGANIAIMWLLRPRGRSFRGNAPDGNISLRYSESEQVESRRTRVESLEEQILTLSNRSRVRNQEISYRKKSVSFPSNSMELQEDIHFDPEHPPVRRTPTIRRRRTGTDGEGLDIESKEDDLNQMALRAALLANPPVSVLDPDSSDEEGEKTNHSLMPSLPERRNRKRLTIENKFEDEDFEHLHPIE